MDSLHYQSILIVVVLCCALILCCTYWLLYVLCVCKRPTVYTGNEALFQFLENHVTTLHEVYCPPPLFFGGRIQSILGILLRDTKPTMLPYTRDVVQLADGGQLALDILYPDWKTRSVNSAPRSTNESRKLIVLLVPGLTTHSQECFMKTSALAVTRAGGVAVVQNNRGFGGLPLTSPRTYSLCDTTDIDNVIDHIKRKFPEDKLMIIGFSLGGIHICHYIVQYPEKAKANLTAAMVISTVWDPWRGLTNLDASGIINKHVVNYGITCNMIHHLKNFQKTIEALGGICDFDSIFKSKTVMEFETRYSIPEFGFKTVEEYYQKSEVTKIIRQFPIPVFALNACDDPMLPEELLPLDEASAPDSNLALIVSRFGGHVGFMEGFLPAKRSVHFLEKVITDIVGALRLGHLESVISSMRPKDSKLSNPQQA